MAMSISTNCVIYTDCESVYKGILKLQKQGWSELSWLSSQDYDLWKGAWSILNFPGRFLAIEWVKAHKCLSSAKSIKEAWQIYHNQMTDRVASVDSNPLPEAIQPIWDRLSTQNNNQDSQRGSVLKYLKLIWARHAEVETSLRSSSNGS